MEYQTKRRPPPLLGCSPLGAYVDRRWYLPVFTPLITGVDILVFYAVPDRGRSLAAPIPIDPERPWLLLSNSLAHADAAHLWGNMVGQLIIGVSTELWEGPVRLAAVYVAAAWFGSFVEAALWSGGDTVLLGASDAIYGVAMMGLATLAMNWAESRWRWFILMYYIVGIAVEVWASVSIAPSNVAVVAHGCGAAMGLCLGIVVTRNPRVIPCERVVIAVVASAVSLAIIVPLIILVAI